MTEQEIDKICEWIFGYIRSNSNDLSAYDAEKDFRKYIKGISENKEEIPPKYDAKYLQSKIDAHTKRMEEQGLTSEQMLEECRGGEYLTWQDVKRIVNIADIHINYTEPTTTEEEYYTEVLRRFMEEE